MDIHGSEFVELSDLIAKRTRTLKIPYSDDGSFFTVDWAPTSYDYATHEAMLAAIREQSMEGTVSALMPVLSGWNITVDGKPLPVSAESITGLGVFVAGSIVRAIQDDFPNINEVKKG